MHWLLPQVSPGPQPRHRGLCIAISIFLPNSRLCSPMLKLLCCRFFTHPNAAEIDTEIARLLDAQLHSHDLLPRVVPGIRSSKHSHGSKERRRDDSLNMSAFDKVSQG